MTKHTYPSVSREGLLELALQMPEGVSLEEAYTRNPGHPDLQFRDGALSVRVRPSAEDGHLFYSNVASIRELYLDGKPYEILPEKYAFWHPAPSKSVTLAYRPCWR